jgi:hypothetical protein
VSERDSGFDEMFSRFVNPSRERILPWPGNPMNQDVAFVAFSLDKLRERAEQAERELAELANKFQDQRKLLDRYELATGFHEQVEARAAAYHREGCAYLSELTTLRATLARVEGERDDQRRVIACMSVDPQGKMIASLAAERDALRAEADGLRAFVKELADATYGSQVLAERAAKLLAPDMTFAEYRAALGRPVTPRLPLPPSA